MAYGRTVIVGLLGWLALSGPAAALCTTYPNPLSNGTVADGGQVMANFNCAALTSGSTLNGITITGTTTLPGSSAISSTGAVGIGMSPAHILDITQNGNSGSVISILNNNAGTAAASLLQATNGTHSAVLEQLSEGYTTNGVLIAGYGGLNTSLGMFMAANGGPILFAANGLTERGRFGTDGSFLVGTTTNAGAGNIGASKLGLGMVPSNILDITQNQNSASKIQILNNNTGAAADSRLVLSNGTHTGVVQATSTGWNTAFFTGGPTTAEQMNVGTTANAPLTFGTNNAARLSITSAGSVGIGTTSPATTLAVVGNVRVGTSGTNGCVQNFAGTALTGTCSSDAALKTVTGEVSQILDKFGRLQLVHFLWNKTAAAVYHNSTSALNTGFIAQEMQRQFPELVSIDSKGYRQIDYTTLSLYGLEATKELKAVSDQQADSLAELQRTISGLKAVNDNQSRTIEKLQARLRDVHDGEAAKIERLEAQMTVLERRVGIQTAQR